MSANLFKALFAIVVGLACGMQFGMNGVWVSAIVTFAVATWLRR